ncbi:MAG: hypothetical protein IT340_02100 [Chloroflexi bacterium]|nr:hypothetical protein [Chloroflexota bacterium]
MRTSAHGGRPSQVEMQRREAAARADLVRLLTQAFQHLNHPSRLSDAPICALADVRRRAAGLRGYRYPSAVVVIRAVRSAHAAAWEELGETADAPCLEVLADALRGVSREESARRAGVCVTEISRRRRAAADMIADRVLTSWQEP